jgi:hypothetical protein
VRTRESREPRHIHQHSQGSGQAGSSNTSGTLERNVRSSFCRETAVGIVGGVG